MKKMTTLEAIAHLAMAALSIVWVAFAWHVLITGGFSKGVRYSKATTYVDGAGAVLMAYLMLSLACIALAGILKRLGAPRPCGIVVSILLLGSPLVYLLAR